MFVPPTIPSQGGDPAHPPPTRPAAIIPLPASIHHNILLISAPQPPLKPIPPPTFQLDKQTLFMVLAHAKTSKLRQTRLKDQVKIAKLEIGKLTQGYNHIYQDHLYQGAYPAWIIGPRIGMFQTHIHVVQHQIRLDKAWLETLTRELAQRGLSAATIKRRIKQAPALFENVPVVHTMRPRIIDPLVPTPQGLPVTEMMTAKKESGGQ